MRRFNHKALARSIVIKQFDDQQRLQKRLGVRWLAEQCNTSPATMSRAMNAKVVDLHTAINICDWLEQSINDFIEFQ